METHIWEDFEMLTELDIFASILVIKFTKSHFYFIILKLYTMFFFNSWHFHFK